MPEGSFPHNLSGLNERPDLPGRTPYRLRPAFPVAGWPPLLRHPIAQTPLCWYRNFDLFPIAYAFRPRLRIRLTLRRVTLLRNPWAFGDTEFHRVYRYSCQHTHFHLLHPDSRLELQQLMERSPTSQHKSVRTKASVPCLKVPDIIGAKPLD